MNTHRIATFSAVALLGLAACQSTPRPDWSDQAELDDLMRSAKAIGLDLQDPERLGAEQNLVAARTRDLLFSRRTDSRTFFVQDQRYGPGRPAGLAKVGDAELLAACRRISGALGIPAEEIADGRILREQLQVARFDGETGNSEVEPPVAGRRMAELTRQVEGLPVFSSRVLMGQTGAGGVGFLEAHWPEVPAAVRKEAHRLAYKVAHGWQAPEQQGARIESVQAGIVHSPAAGFVMDVYPAIRVVYTPVDPAMGRKLMLHLDRDGKPVPYPRQFDLPCVEEAGQARRQQ